MSDFRQGENVDSVFFEDCLSVPESERNLLQSYHRFYKMVSKSLFFEQDSNDGVVQQLRPFEDWLHNNELVETLTEDVQTELKLIWQRAERMDELQTIVRSFHRYKVDLTRRSKTPVRDSITTSFHDCENHWKQISAKLDEVLRNQHRLERKLAISRTPDLATSNEVSAPLDQVQDNSSSPPEVSVASVIHENEQQMDRVENMLLKINIYSESNAQDQSQSTNSSESACPLEQAAREDPKGTDDSSPREELEFQDNKTGDFFLESEQDNRKIFTIRPQFVMERVQSFEESPTEKEQLSVSIKRLDDLASKKHTIPSQKNEKAMDLFKDEFCQDIWKVQENIVASAMENKQTIFQGVENERTEESNSALLAKDPCCGDAIVASHSLNSELLLNDGERLNSLIS